MKSLLFILVISLGIYAHAEALKDGFSCRQDKRKQCGDGSSVKYNAETIRITKEDDGTYSIFARETPQCTILCPGEAVCAIRVKPYRVRNLTYLETDSGLEMLTAKNGRQIYMQDLVTGTKLIDKAGESAIYTKFQRPCGE